MSDSQNKPWWVSSGPPSSATPKFEIPKSEPNEKSEKTETKNESPFFIPEGLQANAINAGIGLITAFMETISKPLNGQEQTSTHDVEACGVCPLCVGVKAIREHDESLADLIESAMKGVTSSAEKLKEVWPNAMESLTESVVSAVIKAMMKR